MTKKRGLGRGLGALIPSQPETGPADEVGQGLRMAAVDAIQPNPHQPRAHIQEESLHELADSIKEHGLIQPLVVQEEADGRYTLIAGERRWRASRQAGLEQVPVVVKETTPQKMLELALIENIQRADLNPLEEAHAYQELIEVFGLTQAQVAQQVGKSRSAVANMVRLLNLPANVQQAVTDEAISGGHARALLPLADEQAQTSVMNQILRASLSVRQTEYLVQVLLLGLPANVRQALLDGKISGDHARVLQALPAAQAQVVLSTIAENHLSVAQTERLVNKLLAGVKPRPKQQSHKEPELRSLEEQFFEQLGFRVDIQPGRKGGRVIIHYYSDEDLQTIYDAIVPSG